MERTCTYKQLIVIIMALSKLTETDTKEFYCTKEGSWKTAMSTCLDLGGKPMSYRDIADAADVKLKQGTTVWTANYGYWEIVESVPQLTKDYVCGYMRFNQEYMVYMYEYTPTTGVEYDACSNRRWYICENEASLWPHGPDTWYQAYQSCKSPNKLWSGHNLYSRLDEENPQFWVKSARKFTQYTLKDTIPASKQLVGLQCGTNEGPVNRDERNNCEQRFQAVCILDLYVWVIITRDDMVKGQYLCFTLSPETRTDDIRLSRSCLQEAPATTPTTTKSTRKTTSKPTRPTTQFITTVKPSQQSTKTFNSTGSLSTPETPITTPPTTASTRKTTLTLNPTEPTTQLTTTAEPPLQSTEIFNGTTFKSTPGELPKTKITIIATTTTGVIICGIVTVILSFCFCRKRRKCNKTHFGKVTFQIDSPSTKSVVLSNNNPGDKVGACNEADASVYDEVNLDFKDDNNVEAAYGNEKQNYEHAYSASEKPNPSYNTAKRMSKSESEYDSANNLKVFNESSNIYNKLGCGTPEGVYDSTMSKPNRKTAFETNVYSKISRGENLYDTTATAGTGAARINGAYVSPDGNVYGYTDRHDNGDGHVEVVCGNEKQDYDYECTYSVSEKPKPLYNTTKRMSKSESEYDSANNFKVFNESSNIYNKLRYGTPEGVYDSTMSKPNRKTAFETNIYSKISRGENLYDTTAAAGSRATRPNGAYVSPDGNIYGYTDRHGNGDSRTYGCLVTGQQFLGI